MCERCGFVVQDGMYDFGRESNATDFEEKSKNTRASGSTSLALHDYGLRTEIALGTKDYAGKSIDPQMADQMYNMRKWHQRTRITCAQDRRLSNVLTKITETCEAMSLPKQIVETAAMLYRDYEGKQEAKGKSIACMAAATIHLACKKCQVVRSLDEIVAATGVTEQDRSSSKLASKYYRMMVMEMGSFSEAQRPTEAPQQQQPHAPVAMAIDHYIAKLSNMAKIDTKVERLAIDIAHRTNDHMLADGKAPNGLAAAYIYIASIFLGINILQRDVSSLSGVTEVTIRNRCKDILSSFKLTVTVKQPARPGFA
jgi:transcription initiation factor TFIIB